MRVYVRVFGTVVGLIWAAYGAAVMVGATTWPIVCRTNCQTNEALRVLLGEVTAERLIGLGWVLAGLVGVAFLNVRGFYLPKRDRRRKKRGGRR